MNAQIDPQWAKVLLGFNKDENFNIGNYGCLITAIGNMYWWITNSNSYNPPTLNTWLKNNNGFVAGGGVMRWPTIDALGHFTENGTAATLGATRAFVATDVNNYAIIEVRTKTNGQHFVMSPIDGQIIDSEDGKLKTDTAYTFFQAHLFTATSTPNLVSQQTNTTLGGDMALTAEEETEAYEIVLNRQPDIVVPDGRTGIAFIRDAKAELTAQRANTASQLATNQTTIDGLNATNATQAATIAELTTENTTLKAEPSTVPAVDTISAAPADFRTTETPYEASLVAVEDGEAVDYSGVKPPQSFIKGTEFTIVSKFSFDGKPYYRTYNSQLAGDWYGVDPSVFSVKLSGSQQLNLVGSQIYGVIAKFFNAFNPLKKEK